MFAPLPEDLAQGGIRQARCWHHEGGELDPGTARFIDAGDPPILVTFCSADLLMKNAAAAYARRVSEMQIGYGPLPASDLAGPMIGKAVTQLLADDLVAHHARALGETLAGPARGAEVDAAIRDIFAVTGAGRPVQSGPVR